MGSIWPFLAPSGALIAILTYYWSSNQLFQITPVIDYNIGLSLSEPSGDDLGTTLAKLGKTLAYSGILWHSLAYSGILWHTFAYSGILWHSLAYPGILWHALA